MSDNSGYEVVWPRGRKTTPSAPLAKRLSSLKSKTIGFVWEYMFRGDEIFPLVENELSRRYPGTEFVGYEVFGNTHGPGEKQVIATLGDKLKQYKCDAAISGVGC